MAHAFSFQSQPSQLLDDHSSVFLYNTQFISSGPIVEEEGMINVNIGERVHVSHEQSSHETASSVVVDSKIINSGCNDQSMVNQINLSDKKRKNSAFSSLNSNQSKENGRGKGKKQKKCNGNSEENKKEEEIMTGGKNLAEKKKDPRKVSSQEESPTGYIHVRARRGQATDRHSLAERVRREKISEKMKALQRLVPGCDKITGKAIVLDEIINYVQTLQNQVEMLTRKLAAVNSFFYDSPGMDVSALMMSEESPSLSSLPSSVLPLQLRQCSPPNQQATFDDSSNSLITTSNAAINYAYPPLHTSSPSLLLPHQNPHHDDFSLLDQLWDMGEQQSQSFQFHIHASKTIRKNSTSLGTFT